MLVNVNTDQLAIVFFCCVNNRSIDTAAASEYNLCAVCEPAFHLSCDRIITIELAAIVILHVYINTHLFRSCINTLYISVTITDNCRNCDTT